MTGSDHRPPDPEWVFYDGDCSFCAGLARRFEAPLGRRGFGFAPLQAPWVQRRLRWPAGKPLEEMRVWTAEGHAVGGADAVLYLARALWWAWPLWVAAHLPFGMPLLPRAYRWVAERRHCARGACVRPKAPGWLGWLPLAAFPPLALAFRSRLSAWAFTFTLSLAIYAACKWQTWWQVRGRGACAGRRRPFGYLLAWPGMDAAAFLNQSALPPKPAAREWTLAVLKTLFGAVLLWSVARMVPPQKPLLVGWVGIVGLLFLLHFGSFHLLALLWQRAGVDARPIMHAPAQATSLGDFWGSRWNLGFRQLSHDLVFQPLRRRLGAAGATLAAFAVSGLIHELVISLPAGDGYGLPTGYFLLQGMGVMVEHSERGRRFGLRQGFSGWLFTLLVTAGPVFWLFHPPFVTRVVLPFMRAVGAVGAVG